MLQNFRFHNQKFIQTDRRCHRRRMPATFVCVRLYIQSHFPAPHQPKKATELTATVCIDAETQSDTLSCPIRPMTPARMDSERTASFSQWPNADYKAISVHANFNAYHFSASNKCDENPFRLSPFLSCSPFDVGTHLRRARRRRACPGNRITLKWARFTLK